jgi:hypothetical protein
MGNRTELADTKVKRIPGITGLKIAEIPAAITQDHSQVLYFWQKSGLKKAVLFHVDAHADMNSGIDACLKDIDNINFICPAVHYGIVSDIYWLNPYSIIRKLQDMGSSSPERKRSRIELATFVENKRIRWKEEGHEISAGSGNIISPEQIHVPEGLILDIDLDAFCCSCPSNTLSRENPTKNWEKRVAEAMGLLEKLRKPSLITITRSQGIEDDILDRYVPADKVDAVQEITVRELQRIYRR